MKNIGKKLAMGSGLRFISLLLSVGIALLMTPYLIETLTDRWYGLWTVIASLLGFYGLLDLGISSATQRYIAEAMPRNDPKELNSIVSTSLAIFTFIGIIAFLITGLMALFAGYFLEDPNELYVFQCVVLISGSGVALNFLFWVLFGVITSNLRYDSISYIQISKTIVRSILFYVFLENGHSIITLAIITVVLDLIGYGILLRFAKKIAPWLQIGFSYFDRGQLPRLFNFGKYSLLISVSEQVKNRTDHLLIPIYLSLSHVTHYAVALQISMYLYQALVSFLSVLVPVYAKYYSEKRYDKLAQEFMRATRFAAILGMLGFGCVVILGKSFISLWLGTDYLDAHIPMLILGFGVLLTGIQIPAINLMFATNKHKNYAFMCIFEIVSNVIMTLVLLPKYGLVGAATGTAASLVITRIFVQPYLILKIVSVTVFRYYFSLIRIIVILSIMHVLMYYIVHNIFSFKTYIDMILAMIIIYIPILLVVYLLVIEDDDRNIVHGLLKR